MNRSVKTSPRLTPQSRSIRFAALRSGRYRVVVNAISGGSTPDTEVVTIDAQKLIATNANGVKML